MSKWKVIDLGNKGKRYMRDGKLVKKAEVPDNILNNESETFEEETIQKVEKKCIFCGAHSNLQRFVNMQTVVVCDEHYYSETMGRVAQKLKETQNA